MKYQQITDEGLSQHKILADLANELKEALVYIARQAEQTKQNLSTNDVQNIEQVALNTLRILDSYLLSNASLYGQSSLVIEPIMTSAVLREITPVAVAIAAEKQQRVIVEDKAKSLIIGNRKLLFAASTCLVSLQTEINQSNEVFVVANKLSNGQDMLGVFASSSDLDQDDLNRAQDLSGRASMPLSEHSFSSSVNLAIAANFATAMGIKLRLHKYRGMRGLGFELDKSYQMSMV